MRPRFFVAPADIVHGDAVPGGLPASTPRSPDESPLVGVLVELARSDARHARTVLRVRPGDPCEVVISGTRNLAEAVFEEVGDRVTVRVTGRPAPGPASRVELLLVQGLPQPRKVDEVVEKGTEVGVDAFLIALAAGSPRVPLERLDTRAARWRSVAAEAAKQSKQLAIPEIRIAVSVEAALDWAGSEGWQSVVLTPSATQHLGSVLNAESAAGRSSQSDVAPTRWALWVGPEGGWSSAEVDLLTAAGCSLATLGSRVLRTETAGLVAAALARYALADW